MGRSSQTIVIGAHTCEFQKLPPKTALKILSRLFKIFGGPVSEAIKSVFNSIDISAISFDDKKISTLDTLLDMDSKAIQKYLPAILDNLGNVFSLLGDRIDEDIVIQTFEEMMPSILVNGKPVNWEMEEFQGDTFFLLKVYVKSIGVNFSSFLGGLREQGGELKN